jgi:hypothetical protein
MTSIRNNIKFILFLSCFSAFCSASMNAQETGSSNKDSDIHEHHKNEIGVSNSPVYFIKEKVFAYGLHLHYTRSIPKTEFETGVGYERIFDEHGHNTFVLELIYRPIEALSLSLSPGLTIEDKNPNPGFALHFETAYEFEINVFHIGPAVEFAYDPEDYHISLGLHLGYGF